MNVGWIKVWMFFHHINWISGPTISLYLTEQGYLYAAHFGLNRWGSDTLNDVNWMWLWVQMNTSQNKCYFSGFQLKSRPKPENSEGHFSSLCLENYGWWEEEVKRQQLRLCTFWVMDTFKWEEVDCFSFFKRAWVAQLALGDEVVVAAGL